MTAHNVLDSRSPPHAPAAPAEPADPAAPASGGGRSDPPNLDDDLKSLPVADVEQRLGYSADGLTGDQARTRLAQYGPNAIAAETPSPVLAFLKYFWGPIAWMIEVAVVLSAVLGHWADFCVILLLLVTNAVVGFWEEHQAGKAIAALKAELAIKARVKRDGTWGTPPAREPHADG